MAKNQLATKTHISDISTSKLKSLLEQDATRINQLLEVGENDSAISLIYKRLTQSCIFINMKRLSQRHENCLQIYRQCLLVVKLVRKL